jgi:hypothetical protein
VKEIIINKMKIILNKVAMIPLNYSALREIKGGEEEIDDSLSIPDGAGRSDRRTGNCAYSRAHPLILQPTDGSPPQTVGCYNK